MSQTLVHAVCRDYCLGLFTSLTTQLLLLQFVKDVAEGILSSWKDIATKRQAMPFSDEHRQWQLLRRGRYLEFNLLYDRGVKFGLSGGRLESIMVSAPPLIAWRYNVVPEAGSAEAKLVAVLQKPVDWASSMI